MAADLPSNMAVLPRADTTRLSSRSTGPGQADRVATPVVTADRSTTRATAVGSEVRRGRMEEGTRGCTVVATRRSSSREEEAAWAVRVCWPVVRRWVWALV